MVNAAGVRISDKLGHFLSPTLGDILEEVHNGHLYHWSVIEIDGVLNSGQKHSLFEFEKKVRESDQGWVMNWNELTLLSNVFFQIYDITIIGSVSIDRLRKFGGGEDLYKTCDFLLNLFDSSYWEVFSNDQHFLCRLKEKFRDVELLDFPN